MLSIVFHAKSNLTAITGSEINSLLHFDNCEYIAIYDSSATNESELNDILSSYNEVNELTVFSQELYDGISYDELIRHVCPKLFCIIISRKIVDRYGFANSRLGQGALFEYICRLSLEISPYFIQCEAAAGSATLDGSLATTCSYILRRSIPYLLQDNLPQFIQAYSDYFAPNNMATQFLSNLSDFLDSETLFSTYEQETAPILILIGNDTCYSALKCFGHELAQAFADMGCYSITSDQVQDLSYYDKTNFRAVIGFQAPALLNPVFASMDCPKLQFWFDHPGFFPDMFESIPKDYYFLCQDEDYANYIKTEYGCANALQLPPGATQTQILTKPLYDISFLGSYMPYGRVKPSGSEEMFYEYMIAHPNITFEEGLRALGDTHSLEDYRLTCMDVIGYYKRKVIEAVLNSGYELHVFGDSWKQYHDAPDNLVIHDAINYQDAANVYANSKISLNIMTWHKAGMTERIAGIMLAGSLCLTDATSYLEHNFDSSELVQYNLNKLDELPDIIDSLLTDDSLRNRIASKGQKIALDNHTWRARAAAIIGILDNFNKR